MGLALVLPMTSAVVTAPPQQNTTILSVNNTTASVVSNSFPFTVTNQNGNLTVSPSYSITPSTYEGDVGLSDGTTHTKRVKIPEVSNWTLSTRSLKNNISVGSNGEIQELNVTLEGNTETRLTANITGNLSQYYDTDPYFDIYPEIPKTLNIGFGVPSDTNFGNYTGQLVLEDGNGTNKTVNLTARFRDEISPKIADADYEDTMATRPSIGNVVVDENLEVDSVTAEIVRTVEEEQGNETVEVNETVGTYTFEKQENTDLWTHDFTDTSVIAPYFAHIKVNDTAGNTVNRTIGFTVDGLDAVQIRRQDFEFDKINEQGETRTVILENTVESPFNLSLNSLNYEGNSSLQVGVVPPDGDQPRYFQDNDDRLEFEQSGEYELVVNSYEEEPRQNLYEYDGHIEVETPEQHYPVENGFFGGTVDSFGYPEARTIFEGSSEFEGYIGYSFDAVRQGFEEEYGSLENTSSADYAYKISRLPVDACRGNSDWGDCSTLMMGEYQDTIDSNSRLQTERDIAIGVAALAVLFVAGALNGTGCRSTMRRHGGF